MVTVIPLGWPTTKLAEAKGVQLCIKIQRGYPIA